MTAMRLSFLRLLPVIPLLGGLTVVGTVTSIGPSAVGCASAASVHHASLVIQHSYGATLTYCIGFDSATVTGQYLLDASGVEKGEVDESNGEAVCQLDGEPQQYPASCWTASSPYWAFYVARSGGAWFSSTLGVSNQTFGDGDAAGFIYESQSSSQPPPSPAGICPPTPPPTTTPAPTSAPQATPQPAHTGTPTAPGIAGGPPPASSAASTSSPAVPATPSASPTAAETPSPAPGFISAPIPIRFPTQPGPPWAGLLAGAFGIALLARIVVVAMRRRHREPSPGLSR